MLSAQLIHIALAVFTLSSARADMPALCSDSSEMEFRKRVHEAGKFDLYDEYGILRALVESRARDYDVNERNIQTYREDAATVSRFLEAMDDEFPGEKAIAIYNELSRYDGISLSNPDESQFKAQLPPTSKDQFEEKFEKLEDPKQSKLEKLRLRYQIAALGVYLDRNAEELQAAQEKHLSDLKAMLIRASLLRMRLQTYCPEGQDKRLYSASAHY